MNLVTLLERTLRLGYWGGSTLFHMAVAMLAGLLLLLFPEEISRFILEQGVVGAISSATAATNTSEEAVPAALMAPVVADTLARAVGFQLTLVGLLFGMFGNVSDWKARQRLNLFTLIGYSGGIAFAGLQLYLRTGLLRHDVLMASIIVCTIGLSLSLLCLYFLTNGPDAAAPNSHSAGAIGRKKNK